MKELLNDAAARATKYLAGLGSRRVAPQPDQIAALQALAGTFPEAPCDPKSVLAHLDDYGSPATVASAGGRYFGFVTGGSLPAALAANWLAGAWDQNAGLWVQSPVAAFLEEVAAGWLREIFRLPAACGVGFVSGATMANFSCLAAARNALLYRAGWNVEEQGLFGAPEIRVIVGGEVHASLLKALALVGFGRKRVTTIPADGQGRMRADELPPLDDRTLVCMQAGNVNTGAFDPANEICLPRPRRGRMGPCRRRIRPVGGGGTATSSSVGRSERSGFLGHRLPQVAECTLRFWSRLRAGSRPSSQRDGIERRLPAIQR